MPLARSTSRLVTRLRELPTTAVDALIALGCYVVIMVDALINHHLTWGVALAHIPATAPLIWRRRYPFLVTCLLGVTTTWLSITKNLGTLPIAQLVATYTFAAYSRPLHRLILGLGTAIGVTVSILGAGDDPLTLAFIGALFTVAYSLGTGTRARGDRIAMLEERARRLAEEQDAAAARERERLARDVHDILAHSISLIVVQAEAGPVVVRSDPARAEEVFDTIATTAREALAQLRRTLGVLRADGPHRSPLPDLGGLPALVATTRLAGLDVTLREDGQVRAVPADVALTVYRLVQESLTNVVRHAKAQRVRVVLDWRADDLSVEVTDDGRGAGEGGNGGPGGHGGLGGLGGLGLAGMRERVAAAGGRLDTGPGPRGVGFRVAAHLPLG
jgi:signal transduction histidine kinase